MKTRTSTCHNRTSVGINLTLFFAFFLISTISFSQTETYEITSQGSLTDVSEYANAMNDGNFDSYRFQSKRRTIVFESGVEVQLLSVNELVAKSVTVDASMAIGDNVSIADEGLWKLTASGHIIRTQSIQFPKKVAQK
ncbi:MAG: hypothetical protein JKY54_02685 [Flavobacteriales bacterium]|nr:hypothetical protein [Flavobacteriales bacterium]